jgi:hypothetical protein
LSRYWEYFFLLLLRLLTILLIGDTIIVIIVIGVITPTVPASIMIVSGTLILGAIDTSATAESILIIITGTEDIGMTNTREPREEHQTARVPLDFTR